MPSEAANFRKFVGVVSQSKVCPDGTVNTTYSGSTVCPPAAATLVCADNSGQTSMSGLVTSNAYSADVGTYFSGTGKSTATYTLATVSGDSAASNGWALSGSIGTTLSLTNAGTDSDLPGSGSLRVVGTPVDGPAANCGVLNWSYIAPPSTDTTPPSFVTGVTSPTQGASTVTLEWESTSDPDDGVQRSGVAAYNIYRNGLMVDSLAASSAGLVTDWTCAAIGTVGGSPSGTQGSGASGATWTQIGGGAGIDGTADNVYACSSPVSGPAVHLRGRISAISTGVPANDNKAALELRASLAQDAIAANCTAILVNGVLYVQSRNRSSTGGSRSSAVTSIVAASFQTIYLDLYYDSNGLDCGYSFDGGAPTYLLTDRAITLPDAKYAAFLGTANQAGQNLTITWDDVSVTTAGRLSKSVTAAAGTATWTVRPEDADGNETVALAGVDAAPGAPSSTAVKFQPGYYVRYEKNCRRWDGAKGCTATEVQSYINSVICPNANLKGIEVNTMWASLEDDTQGDYDGVSNGQAFGFTWVDSILSTLAACNKYLKLTLTTAWYGGIGTPTFYWPAYIVNGASYGTIGHTQPSQPGTTAKTWEAPTVAAQMALVAAYCARYDSNPNFYALTPFYDSSLPMTENSFTNGHINNSYTIMTQARVDCPTTNLTYGLTHVLNDSQMAQGFAVCVAMDCNMEGTDVLINVQNGNQAWYVGDSVEGHDYRGEIRFTAEAQAVDMCTTKYGHNLPADIFAATRFGNGSNRDPWWPNSWTIDLPLCDGDPNSPYGGTAWLAFLASISGQVMNARDSTLRTTEAVRTGWCEDNMVCP